MSFKTLFALLLLTCVCVAWAQVSYDDCCLSFARGFNRRIQRHSKSFRVQERDGGCNVRAVIFRLSKGKEFCSDPDAPWVKRLIEKIEDRRWNKNFYAKSFQEKSFRP